GHDEVAGGEALRLAAATAEKRERVDAELFRLGERGEDVAGIAARGEDDDEIARLREPGDLAREHLIVAEIVADAAEERAVRREGEGRERPAGLRVAADEFGGEMRRLGRAATVAADQKFSAALERREDHRA